MMVWMKRLNTLLLALLLSGLAACGPDPSPSKKEDPMIEWMKGQINCPKQADHMPALDHEGETLFNQALDIEKYLYPLPRLQWHPKIDQAIDLYKRAAARGNPYAMNNLANIYYFGEGIPEDAKEGLFWIKQMYAQDTPLGDYTLGVAYARGMGGLPRDRGKARELYVKAAKRGNPDALYILAESLFGLENPDVVVNRMLQCAIDQGHKEAALALALNHRVMGDYTKSLRAMRAGAKLGHPGCLTELSGGYRRDPDDQRAKNFNWFGLRQDKQRADCLFKLSQDLYALPGDQWRDPAVAFPDLDERCPPNVEQPPGLE